MKKSKENFWKYALSECKNCNRSIALQDMFLKWASKESLTLKQAQNTWNQVQADVEFTWKGPASEVNEAIQNMGGAETELGIEPDMAEAPDVTEEMRDAIDEKKEEKQEGVDPEQLTLIDSLGEDDEEAGMPEAPPAFEGDEAAGLPEELPPLPAGSV